MKRRIQSSPFDAHCQYVVKCYSEKKCSEIKISVKFAVLLPHIWGLGHHFWRLSKGFYGRKKNEVHYSILITALPVLSTARAQDWCEREKYFWSCIFTLFPHFHFFASSALWKSSLEWIQLQSKESKQFISQTEAVLSLHLLIWLPPSPSNLLPNSCPEPGAFSNHINTRETTRVPPRSI